MDTPNETISEAVRHAAVECATGTRYWTPGGIFSARCDAFEPIIQRAITDATAEQAQRIAEMEGELRNDKMRLKLARSAILHDGYFTEDEVGPDIGPRIIERLSKSRETIADLQSCVTFAEQRAQDRQEQLTGLRRKAAEAEQTCNTYRKQLEQVRRDRDAERVKHAEEIKRWATERDELLPMAYPPCPECGCEDRNESDMTLKCECPAPLKGK